MHVLDLRDNWHAQSLPALPPHRDCQKHVHPVRGKGFDVESLVSIPPFHILGAGLIHVDPIRKGEPVYIMSRFDLKRYVSMIERYGVTDIACTPLIVLGVKMADSEAPRAFVMRTPSVDVEKAELIGKEKSKHS